MTPTRRALVSPRRALVFVLLAAALGGCRAAPAPPDEGGPPTELAARPRPLSPELSPSASPGVLSTAQPAGEGSETPGRTGTGGGSGSTPAHSETATAAPRPFRTVGSTSDPAGDAGLETPPHGDLRAVRIEDDGASARITVDVDAALPNPMPAGEQIGVGVDLYRGAGAAESDYQVFASGTEDGWFAYLHTPKGLVDYPGSFQLGANRIVFTLRWSSLGNLAGSRFRAFLDWDRQRPVLNQAGEDRAPDTGRASFAR